MTEIYKDPLVQIDLADKPCTKGHVIVKSSKNINEFNKFEDLEISHLFYASSYTASALFELLGAHGTNIILTDLPDQELKVDVLVRVEDDGLDFNLKRTQANPEELKETAKNIFDNIEKIKWQQEHPDADKPVSIDKKEVVEEEGKTNYLLKSLKRTP